MLGAGSDKGALFFLPAAGSDIPGSKQGVDVVMLSKIKAKKLLHRELLPSSQKENPR